MGTHFLPPGRHRGGELFSGGPVGRAPPPPTTTTTTCVRPVSKRPQRARELCDRPLSRLCQCILRVLVYTHIVFGVRETLTTARSRFVWWQKRNAVFFLLTNRLYTFHTYFFGCTRFFRQIGTRRQRSYKYRYKY